MGAVKDPQGVNWVAAPVWVWKFVPNILIQSRDILSRNSIQQLLPSWISPGSGFGMFCHDGSRALEV